MRYNQLRTLASVSRRSPAAVLCATIACLVTGLCRADAVELASVDELSRGERGYGLTVIEGTRIDTFGVEIMGVERNSMLPGRDLILVRLSGLGLENTGIVRGMSGSPVYVDGRLVGAVAWGWSYAEEPVGLLTPIHEMLTVMAQDLTAPAEGTVVTPEARDDPTGLVRLASPVWVSGMGATTSRWMADLLSPLGLEPLAAPAGQDPMATPAAPAPGGAIGVQLVGGDLSLTAIGTVTHVDGDRLVAFGHSFVGSGAVDLPLTGVHMYGVLDNRVASFKLGTATGIVGALRQDRFGAIAGLTGAEAQVLPVAVSVDAEVGTREFAFDVARHRFFTAGLTRVCLMGALESTAKVVGEVSLELSLDIELVDGRSVAWRQVYSGVNAVGGAIFEAGVPLRALTRSPFDDLRVASVSAHARVLESIRSARIAGARFDRARVRPGASGILTVVLNPYRGQPRTVDVELDIPADANGSLLVRVGSGRAALAWEDSRLAAETPSTSDDLLRRLNRARRDDELVVEVLDSGSSVAVAGRELPAPPPSVQRLLSERHAAGGGRAVPGHVVARRRVPVDFVLVGEQALTLTVDPRGSR